MSAAAGATAGELLREHVGERRAPALPTTICNGLVRLFARYYGRGPTKCRAFITSELVIVSMRDAMTCAEEQLILAGEAASVRTMRRSLQDSMRGEAVAIIERAVERGVTAYLADIDTDANVAIVVFILERDGENGPVRPAAEVFDGDA